MLSAAFGQLRAGRRRRPSPVRAVGAVTETASNAQVLLAFLPYVLLRRPIARAAHWWVGHVAADKGRT
jgi:hypothetical protein